VRSKETTKSAERVFGKEIGRLRGRLGISQEELGFRTGLHRTYVSQLERGLKSPTLGVILKLARILGTSSGKLVSNVEKKTRQMP
jgi:transcriptional regulator with XRE-family HTH domain